MTINKFIHSSLFHAILAGIGAVIVLLLVFGAGVAVGLQKASFSYRWGENYQRNFGGPRGGFLGMPMDRDFINGHGIAGSVLKIDGATLVIKGEDNVERTIVTSDKTIVRNRDETVQAADLKVDDRVVVIGSPNSQGQIEAKFIRVLPASSPAPMPPLPNAL